MTDKKIRLQLHSQSCEVSYTFIKRPKIPIVVVHGFGSVREDYIALSEHPYLQNHSFLSYDAPGHGQSKAPTPEKLTVRDNYLALKGLLKTLDISDAHFVYHSMGGIPVQWLATKNPACIKSLTNIEGNMAPEDCIYSRRIYDYKPEDDDIFFRRFCHAMSVSTSAHEPEYGHMLPDRISAKATGAYFRSIIKHTDEDGLLEQFIKQDAPKHFIYGEENKGLSYIQRLKQSNVLVTEIPESGHLPMFSNPTALWQTIAEFISKHA